MMCLGHDVPIFRSILGNCRDPRLECYFSMADPSYLPVRGHLNHQCGTSLPSMM